MGADPRVRNSARDAPGQSSRSLKLVWTRRNTVARPKSAAQTTEEFRRRQADQNGLEDPAIEGTRPSLMDSAAPLMDHTLPLPGPL